MNADLQYDQSKCGCFPQKLKQNLFSLKTSDNLACSFGGWIYIDFKFKDDHIDAKKVGRHPIYQFTSIFCFCSFTYSTTRN